MFLGETGMARVKHAAKQRSLLSLNDKATSCKNISIWILMAAGKDDKWIDCNCHLISIKSCWSINFSSYYLPIGTI